MTNKKRAETNKQLWDKANSSHRQRWQVLSQKGYDFYLNEQLTKEIMKYFVTANNPRWKAVGATGDDVDVAQVHSEIADYCWYYSNGKSIYSQVVLDSLTKGIGYFMVDVDRDADRGMGEVEFKKIDPYDVYVDPASRDFLFRDANFISVRKNVSKTQLMNLFPEFANKMRKVSGNSGSTNYSQRPSTDLQSIQPEDITMGITIEGEDDDIIPYYETYSKKKHAYRNVFIKVLPSPAEMEQIKENVEQQVEQAEREISVSLKEKMLSIQQSLESGEIIEERAQLEMERAQQMSEQAVEESRMQLMSQAQDAATIIDQQIMTEESYQVLVKSEEMESQIIEAIKFYENRVHLTCTVGDDVFLYERVIPISEYPIVPIPYMYTGTPYPMSAVTPLIGKQQEINKAHQIMLHNANLASNLRWMYEEGSVPEEEWEQYSSSPGALLKYRQGFAPPSPVMLSIRLLKKAKVMLNI